ncbi:SRPBCC family protein, partial [Cobetia marina]
MPTVNRSALVRHSAQSMFDLVNDFERYPEFLPGCSDAQL